MKLRPLFQKTAIAVTSTAIVMGLAAGIVAAQTNSSAAGSRQTNAQIQKVSNLKNRADQEINRRLTTLNSLLTKITASKKLSDTNKSSLSTLIQSDITNLTTLKSKIAVDSDLATLRSDVQLIVKDYRIYLLIRPKAGIVVAGDTVLANTEKLSTLAGKLQTRISQAQAAGKDVSALQTAYTDMQAKIADAQKQALNAQTAVMPLTPEGYPANKTTLLSAVGMLKTARTDMQTARKDAETIIRGLKTLRDSKASSPSANSR